MRRRFGDHGRFGREVVPRPHLAKRRPLRNSADSLPSFTEQANPMGFAALNPSYYYYLLLLLLLLLLFLLLLFQWTTIKISHCFRCCFALRAAERRGFRGDGETAGCFFAAFNSDVSERCSLLHTSRKMALTAS